MPQDDVRKLHGEQYEKEYCLGKECPYPDCRVCPAAGKAKFVNDITDSFRNKIQGGYYSRTVIAVKDEKTGKTRLEYVRPG